MSDFEVAVLKWTLKLGFGIGFIYCGFWLVDWRFGYATWQQGVATFCFIFAGALMKGEQKP